ncbi:MAG: glycosyltransferase family 4 protein [Lachnospiraceae bacterium]|nr:glycosyltransferase family 4 protein [Lachnospiraceae bacterium]
MKKILIIRTFPSILDPEGYNIQEIGLAKALVRAGLVCDVVLYNGSNPDEIKEITVPNSEAGVVRVFMRHGLGILKNGFFPGLKDITKGYDILQVHEYDQITSWMYYAFTKDKPVVIYHGPYYDDYNKGYNLKCRVFDNTFLRLKSADDTLCFTKSRAAVDFLLSKGFKKAIPLGVGLDIENFEKTFDDSDQPILDEHACRNFLYVGKIEPRRNSYLLLDIMSKLADKYDDIHMTVIGSGDREYVEEWRVKADSLVRRGVLTYIEKMSQTKLRDIYKKSDLMIFPSNYEIFGMVLLEAMYFDLPVISSDNGGSDTLITDGFDGVIVKEFDALSWVDSISILHDDANKYRSIKNNLILKDHSIYTWDGIARQYIEAIKDI